MFQEPHIRVLLPVTADKLMTEPRAGKLYRSLELEHGIRVTRDQIEFGPASIESEYEEMLAVPDSIVHARQAEADGVGAVILDCMGDPGLNAVRESLNIPVFGPSQTSMHVASMLGHSFSILTILDRQVHVQEQQVLDYGLGSKLASVRSVDIPVLSLDDDLGKVADALFEQGRLAIEKDRAHVLILGCTGMIGLADQVKEKLHAAGHADVPVIDPIPVTIHAASAIVRSQLSHSKKTYPNPDYTKQIVGFPWRSSESYRGERGSK